MKIVSIGSTPSAAALGAKFSQFVPGPFDEFILDVGELYFLFIKGLNEIFHRSVTPKIGTAFTLTGDGHTKIPLLLDNMAVPLRYESCHDFYEIGLLFPAAFLTSRHQEFNTVMTSFYSLLEKKERTIFLHINKLIKTSPDIAGLSMIAGKFPSSVSFVSFQPVVANPHVPDEALPCRGKIITVGKLFVVEIIVSRQFQDLVIGSQEKEIALMQSILAKKFSLKL